MQSNDDKKITTPQEKKAGMKGLRTYQADIKEASVKKGPPLKKGDVGIKKVKNDSGVKLKAPTVPTPPTVDKKQIARGTNYVTPEEVAGAEKLREEKKEKEVTSEKMRKEEEESKKLEEVEKKKREEEERKKEEEESKGEEERLKEEIEKILAKKNSSDCIVPYLQISDTIVYNDKTINRDMVKRVQTPQLSKTQILIDALKSDEDFTDESSAIVAFGGKRKFILGEEDAHKITFAKDLNKIPCLATPSLDSLSGTGFDVHAFEDGGIMWLGGVKIESDFSFKAHSDGDVAIHALIDALLGAAGMGDIGMMFPDNDNAYKGIDSKILLSKVVTKIYNFGFVIVNVDVTIAAQKPRLSQYKQEMRRVLSEILKINSSRVNIKATTTEKLGFIGRAEGVGVIANANLKYFDWTKI